MATTNVFTADDLLTMPDDGYRYELIEGELHRMPAGGLEHGRIGRRFASRLGDYVDEQGLGDVFGPDTGFYFDPERRTVRIPDIAFVRADRLPPPDERAGFSPVVPDLAVEIISPTDRQRDVDDKVAFYLAHAVPLVWTVLPRTRTVVAHRPDQAPRTFGAGDVLAADDILPGFRLPVADIFR